MKRLFVLFPILAGALWGSVGIFVRTLSGFGVNSQTVLSSRVLFAAILLFLGILLFDRSLLRIQLRDLWVFLGGGLLGMMGLNFCYNEAINQLTLSLAAVLLSMAPIFVMLFAAILFHEKITLRKVGSMLLAILGCFLASGVLSGAGMRWSPAGILVGVCSAFFYALYSVFSKVAAGRGYHPLTITFYCLVAITLALLPFTDWGMLGAFAAQAPLKHAVFMLLHSLCTSVLPYVLFTVSLTHIEAGKASILAAGEPVAAMLFGALFFSELPTALSLTGLGVTILALALLCMPEKQAAARTP